MKQLKRSLSLVLVLAMCLGLLQTAAFATETGGDGSDITTVIQIDNGSSPDAGGSSGDNDSITGDGENNNANAGDGEGDNANTDDGEGDNANTDDSEGGNANTDDSEDDSVNTDDSEDDNANTGDSEDDNANTGDSEDDNANTDDGEDGSANTGDSEDDSSVPTLSDAALAFIDAVNAIPAFNGENGEAVAAAGAYASGLLEELNGEDYANAAVLAAMAAMQAAAEGLTGGIETLGNTSANQTIYFKTVEVYDVTKHQRYTFDVGTAFPVSVSPQSYQTSWTIPELSEFLAKDTSSIYQNYTYTMATSYSNSNTGLYGVTSSGLTAIGGGSSRQWNPGQSVEPVMNNPQYKTITYYVTAFTAGSSGTGGNTSEDFEYGGGSKQYSATVVYHSNYPDGTDYTVTQKLSLKMWTSVINIFDFPYKTYESCSFGGYTPKETSSTWYTDKACTVRQSSTLFVQGNGATIHLYAGWKGSGTTTETVKLTYIDRGETYDEQTYPAGTNVLVLDCGNVNDGYTFMGWDTSPSATTVVYAPDDDDKGSFVIRKDTILYAVWQKKGSNDDPYVSETSREGAFTVVKQFKNLPEEQIPASFRVSYKVEYTKDGVKEPYTESGTVVLTQSGANMTGTIEPHVWQIPSAWSDINNPNHGELDRYRMIITLTESNADVADYTYKLGPLYPADGTANGDSVVFEIAGHTIEKTLTLVNTYTKAEPNAPALSISKQVDKTEVMVGESVTYTIAVTNTGTADASGVTVSDPLNTEYLQWTGAALNGEEITPDSTGLYTIGTVEKSGSATLKITAKAVKEGTIPANTATLNPDGDDEKTGSSDPVTARKALTIEITGNTGTKVYDATEKTVTGYTYVVKDKDGNVIELPGGLSISPAGSIAKGTEVGKYPMELKAENFSVTGENAGKYTVTFTVTDGWLQIVPSSVLAVTAGDVTVVYDGQPHPVTPNVTFNGQPVENAEVTVTYTDEQGNPIEGAPKNAGKYKATVTARYEGQTATATANVTINKRPLSVATGSASKTYDGTPLTNATAAVTVTGGAVAGEDITAAATGSQTEVGSSSNTYTMNWGNADPNNYEVTENLGTLTVNRQTSGGNPPKDDDDDDDDRPPVNPPKDDDDDRPSGTPGNPTTPNPPAVDIPEEDVPLTDLPEEDVPLTDIPEEDVPLTDIPEEDVPLTDIPEEDVPLTDIPEEDVPLANVPKTGDSSNLWLALSVMSLMGLVALSGRRRKEAEA